MTAPSDNHVPNTEAEFAQALAFLVQEARAALNAGNDLRYNRRHEQINDRLTQWQQSCSVPA